MSRSTIAACAEVFRILREAADVDPARIPAGIRYVRGSPEEVHCLAHAEFCDKIAFTQRIVASRWRYKDKDYLSITGIPQVIPSATLAIGPESENAGLLTAIIAQGVLPLKEALTPESLLQVAFGTSSVDAGYVGHDVNTLLEEYFQPIEIFEITDDSLSKNLAWLTFGILVDSPTAISLKFSAAVIQRCRLLRDQCSDAINYESLVDMLLGGSWKHAFMDAYRCVEYYYPLVITKDLFDQIGFTGTLEDLWSAVYEKFAWRPKEETQLVRIVHHHSDIVAFGNLGALLGCTNPEKLAHYIYSQRNSIVHYRMRGAVPHPVSLDLWNSYIDFLLGCVQRLPVLVGGGQVPQTAIIAKAEPISVQRGQNFMLRFVENSLRGDKF